MLAIASVLVLGAAPPGGVVALRKRPRQSSSATVKKALSSEPSVLRFASVVVWVLLAGGTKGRNDAIALLLVLGGPTPAQVTSEHLETQARLGKPKN